MLRYSRPGHTTCLLVHKWGVKSDNGKTVYRECKNCGRREIIQNATGCYQPIAYSFLDTGVVSDGLTHPPSAL